MYKCSGCEGQTPLAQGISGATRKEDLSHERKGVIEARREMREQGRSEDSKKCAAEGREASILSLASITISVFRTCAGLCV